MVERMRLDYRRGELILDDLCVDPIDQFLVWFAEAREVESETEANAMTVATATPDGRPSARVVLLKGIDQAGFRFFTSYVGRKSQEIAANPHAALVFFWHRLERQVRVEGRIERLSPVESEHYFRSRPIGSQVASLLSTQSSPLLDRDAFERDFESRLLAAESAPVEFDPERWGGYVVIPECIEFWQGRSSRLHDRFVYRRSESGWTIQRLSP